MKLPSLKKNIVLRAKLRRCRDQLAALKKNVDVNRLRATATETKLQKEINDLKRRLIDRGNTIPRTNTVPRTNTGWNTGWNTGGNTGGNTGVNTWNTGRNTWNTGWNTGRNTGTTWNSLDDDFSFGKKRKNISRKLSNSKIKKCIRYLKKL